MADILSQQEIDALLSATDGDGGQSVQPAQPVQTVKWPVGAPEVGPAPAVEGRGWGRTQAEAEERATALPAGVDANTTHAYIFANKRAAAAVLRTILRKHQGGGEGLLSALSHQQIAAAFIIGLGREVAPGVLDHLEREEMQAVAAAIIAMPEVDHRVALQALEMVRQRMVAGDYVEVGGADYARNVLGQDMVDRALHPSEEGFKLLEKVDTEVLAPFISHEHPQTIALILSQIKPALAAGLMGQLPERLQQDVAYRISMLGKVTAQTMERVEETLGRILRELLSGVRDVGGPKVAADILNLTGSSVEKNVLDQMDSQDPEVAEAVRNLMFIFEDIGALSDRDIQVLLRELEQKDLVISLKAATEKVKEKILGNMSEEARQSLTEEMEFIGPMRLSEVEQVQLRIVHKVRELEAQEQLTIMRGDSAGQFV